MKLRDFLDATQIKPAALARAVCRPTSTITRLLNDERPDPKQSLLADICAATRGYVQPNDFMADKPETGRRRHPDANFELIQLEQSTSDA